MISCAKKRRKKNDYAATKKGKKEHDLVHEMPKNTNLAHEKNKQNMSCVLHEEMQKRSFSGAQNGARFEARWI